MNFTAYTYYMPNACVFDCIIPYNYYQVCCCHVPIQVSQDCFYVESYMHVLGL